jgi:Domain of unknown function (DUF5666)
LHGRDYTDAINLASRLERLNKRYGSSTIASNTIVDRAKEAFDFRPLDVVGAITRGKIERCEAIALSLGRKLQPISTEERFFNMKMAMFALVLAIGMAFSAFAADEPPKIVLEGVIQQLPVGRLFGIWMVSQRAVVVTEATVIEEEDGPIRVGAKVDVKGFVQPDGSITATNIETDE